ncbi:PMCA-type calcium-translocating P-type ATPase [Absidia repens]|uniref:Calcium-transporting ATPase n=1 Tax=Absidia repens TaxID=90262 RepID=A0A1X2IN56_9FUNG|nr:PMCA-type calcium-translocating P-type ATPase [Absidia repens]
MSPSINNDKELINESNSSSSSISTPTAAKDQVKLTMIDPLTPHTDENNPFAFTPTQLATLMDPKNLPLLSQFGGLKGVARGLYAKLQSGLSSTPESEHIKNAISLDTVLSNTHNTEDGNMDDEKIEIQHNELPASSTTTHFDSRAAIFGHNVLPPAKSKNIFELMWMAFKDKTLILLTIAAAVSLAVGLYEDIAQPEYDTQGNKIPGVKWVEGVAIIVAVVIVVLVGSVNDFQKEKQFRKLNAKKEDRSVKATRDGSIALISVHDILVGDILHLEPGDIVAADGIFIEGHNLKCDESAATGESDAVRKQSWEICYRVTQTITNEHKDSALHSSNNGKDKNNDLGQDEKKDIGNQSKSVPDPFILSGSKVIEGVCTYLVTGVGVNSYNGRTMMALRTDSQTTPLQEKLNGLAEMIAKLGSAAGLVMLVAVLIRYFVGWKTPGVMPTSATHIVADVMNILIVVVTIVVVAVPEGLPLAVTLALAYATQRMLKDNNLVRVLAACETMGNATTVCSDKTGTLTQNKMSVVAGTLGASLRFLKDAPDSRKDLIDIDKVKDKTPKAILDLVHDSIAINSTAFEGKDENGQLCFVGNKTETALLTFSQDTDAEHYETLRTKYPVEQLYPFSSTRKAMATIVRMPHPSQPDQVIYRAHVKGASEILMRYCGHILSLKPSEYKDSTSSASTRAMTAEDQNRMDRIIQSYASRSLRTIGMAYRDFEQWPPQGEEIEVPFEDLVDDKGLVMIGVVGIEDPLRPGVKEAVKACQQAGVFVRMVTGDNMITAKSIAKQCGIYTSGGIVMEGPVFRNLPSSEMDAILPRLQVLARSSPEDKQILVGRLQELGDIVAVTGDGTNDGPALKLADVGFSMGIAGTEVAKEASSIILMDDNFSSIVKAIMWGRCVNDAVKKFLEFQLTVNVTAVVLTFISAVVSSKQKSVLTAVQLLWVNLIMDTFAALALATDPPTEELLHRAPEPRSSPLITFKMWKMIIGQAIFQITVTLVLLYSDILHYDAESEILQTIVFNTFVFCQIFNEINCRRIDSKLNVFTNIWANKFFLFIFALCVFLQAIIVNFGGAAFQVTPVDGTAWAISIVVGLFSLPVGVVVRLIPDDIFGFIFYSAAARQRYLGTSDKSVLAPPTVYVTGNDRVAWSGANGNQQQTQFDLAATSHTSVDKLSKASSVNTSLDSPSTTPPDYEDRASMTIDMDGAYTKK